MNSNSDFLALGSEAEVPSLTVPRSAHVQNRTNEASLLCWSLMWWEQYRPGWKKMLHLHLGQGGPCVASESVRGRLQEVPHFHKYWTPESWGSWGSGAKGEEGWSTHQSKSEAGSKTDTQNYPVTSNSSPGYVPNRLQTSTMTTFTTAKGGNNPNVHPHTDRHTNCVFHRMERYSATQWQGG